MYNGYINERMLSFKIDPGEIHFHFLLLLAHNSMMSKASSITNLWLPGSPGLECYPAPIPTSKATMSVGLSLDEDPNPHSLSCGYDRSGGCDSLPAAKKELFLLLSM